MKITRNVSGLVLLVATGGLAMAHTGATGIVKERMDGMGILAKSMKSLVQMEKSGDIDFDALKIVAAQIKNHSGQAMVQKFPEGHSQKVSEASPAIWEDWERFSSIANQLHNAASRLEAGANAGDVDLKATIAVMGETCSGCHRDFRIKK